MTICLNTYEPLVFTGTGRKSCKKHGFPSFIDSSCRREPDFESKYPSITALCRKDKFAPKREEGDIIIYLSYKGKYDFDFIQDRPDESHWRLVAILEVIQRCESHQEAADWYKDQERNLRLPYNCMIQGTEPFSLDKTCSLASAGFKSLREWDQSYWDTAQTYPVFLICKAQYLNLKDPPAMAEKMSCKLFGCTPKGHPHGTENPYCKIKQSQLNDLKRVYNIKR
jgi:hypothetical protein